MARTKTSKGAERQSVFGPVGNEMQIEKLGDALALLLVSQISVYLGTPSRQKGQTDGAHKDKVNRRRRFALTSVGAPNAAESHAL